MKNENSKKYNCVNPFNYIRSLAVLCVFLLHVSLFSGQLGFVYTEQIWILKDAGGLQYGYYFCFPAISLVKDLIGGGI